MLLPHVRPHTDTNCVVVEGFSSRDGLDRLNLECKKHAITAKIRKKPVFGGTNSAVVGGASGLVTGGGGAGGPPLPVTGQVGPTAMGNMSAGATSATSVAGRGAGTETGGGTAGGTRTSSGGTTAARPSATTAARTKQLVEADDYNVLANNNNSARKEARAAPKKSVGSPSSTLGAQKTLPRSTSAKTISQHDRVQDPNMAAPPAAGRTTATRAAIGTSATAAQPRAPAQQQPTQSPGRPQPVERSGSTISLGQAHRGYLNRQGSLLMGRVRSSVSSRRFFRTTQLFYRWYRVVRVLCLWLFGSFVLESMCINS